MSEHIYPISSQDDYLYVGQGDHCVMVAEYGDIPRWRNSMWFTPEMARKLAAALHQAADRSEMEVESDGE